MNKENKIPLIRFKGYTEDWEQRKLGELGSLKNGMNFSKDAMGHGYAFVNLQNIFGNNVVDSKCLGLAEASEKQLLEYSLQQGDVLFVRSSVKLEGVGEAALVAENLENTTYSGFIIRFRDEYGLNNDFKKIVFSTKNVRDQIMSQATNSANKNISQSVLENLIFKFPSLAEQQKIGSYFQNLDNLITLHQRKCESLKKVKKSMLQKMFPKNGESVPEIRFAGFTDPWEQRKLGEVVLIERGGSPRPIEDYITNNKNGLNWVKIGDAPKHGNYITKTTEKIRPEGLSKTRQVQPGDLILSNSMSFGRPYIMAINGCIHDGWLLIRDTEKKFDLSYLCQLLGTSQMIEQYKAFAAGSTVNNLNKELVGNTVVSIPPLAEQQKIGSYFQSLDNLITLHQRKVEKLKNIKKSMLQKMFV